MNVGFSDPSVHGVVRVVAETTGQCVTLHFRQRNFIFGRDEAAEMEIYVSDGLPPHLAAGYAQALADAINAVPAPCAAPLPGPTTDPTAASMTTMAPLYRALGVE